MSAVGALSGAPFPEPAQGDAVRPFWLRPVALLLILGLHGVVFYSVKSRPAALSPSDVVEVSLVALGDAAEDQKKQAEITPAEQARPEPPPPVERVETPELTAPPPQVVAPDAIPVPAENVTPPPVAPPPVEKAEEKPQPKPVETKPVAAKPVQRVQKVEERKAQEARQEMKRGATQGAARVSTLSPAAYAGLLAAEIRRRTFYPSAARAAGATGVVGVAFTIGPSGRVVSQSITSSSGNPILDSAARTTLSSVRTPPPPGGRFSTSTNIRFHFN
jgi:protein TonB